MKLEYRECDMLYDCYNKLSVLNNYSYVAIEVPHLSRCIDMVLINDENEIISIEFKLSDWKSAIKQARDHSLGANMSYICLPLKKSVSADMEAKLKEYGIGLLKYDHNSIFPFETVIQASSRSKWAIWSDSLRSRVIQLSTAYSE